MKIVDVRIHVLPAEWKEWVIIRVETEKGIIGYGEGTLDYRTASVVGAIQECAEILVGKSAIGIERHWNTLYRSFISRGGPVEMSALAAFDMALWDIAGKAAGLPVHRLLGGPFRDSVRVYLNQWYRNAKSPEELAEMAQAAVARGATALKWYPLRFIPMTEQVHLLSQPDLKRAVREVEMVRDAVGPDVELAVDLACRLDRTTAIQFCHAVEPYNLVWVEEPIGPENTDVMHEITRATRVRTATGERLSSRWDFRTLIEKQACGYIQPDVAHVGGITEFRKIAAMAEAYMIGVSPHNPLGPVANAASVQVSAALPNITLLEAYEDDVPPIRKQITIEGPSLVGDSYTVPDAPGLGISLDHSALERLSVGTLGHRKGRSGMS